jgi:hypothetical protein
VIISGTKYIFVLDPFITHFYTYKIFAQNEKNTYFNPGRRQMTLIKSYIRMDESALEDIYLAMASTIEKSLIQAGAKQGKDYTILDCYKLAQPFVLEVFKNKNSDITFEGGFSS